MTGGAHLHLPLVNCPSTPLLPFRLLPARALGRKVQERAPALHAVAPALCAVGRSRNRRYVLQSMAGAGGDPIQSSLVTHAPSFDQPVTLLTIAGLRIEDFRAL